MSLVLVQRPCSDLCCPSQLTWPCVRWWPFLTLEGGRLDGAWGWMVLRDEKRTWAPALANVCNPSHNPPAPSGAACQVLHTWLVCLQRQPLAFQICLFFAVYPGTWTMARSHTHLPLPSEQLLCPELGSVFSNARMSWSFTKLLAGISLGPPWLWQSLEDAAHYIGVWLCLIRPSIQVSL